MQDSSPTPTPAALQPLHIETYLESANRLARHCFRASTLSGEIRTANRDLSEVPTVALAYLAKQPSMPADWLADAQAELVRRAEEAMEYTGEHLAHAYQPIRLPSGYRFVGGL